MTIVEKIKNTLSDTSDVLTRKKILELIIKKYPDTNQDSLTIQDYCYNRINKGTKNTIFLKSFGNGQYQFLGENYPYDGDIYHNGNIVGHYSKGKRIIF